MIKNESGFAIVTTTLVISILCSAIWAIWTFSDYHRMSSRAAHVCQRLLLETQDSVGRKIQSLLALNPEIKILRINETRLQLLRAALILAQDYPAVIIVDRQIKLITLRQRQLSLQQIELITAANFQLKSAQLKIKAQITKFDFEDNKSFFNHQHSRWNFSTPQIAVIRNEDSEAPPTYGLHEPFTELQAVQVIWKENSNLRDQGALQWGNRNLNGNRGCAASLSHSRGAFSPNLRKVKF